MSYAPFFFFLAFPDSTQYILTVDTFSLPLLQNKLLRVETMSFSPLYPPQSLAYCLEYCRNSSIYPTELDWTFWTFVDLGSGPHTEGFMLSGWVMVRSHPFWATGLTENIFYLFRKKNQWRTRTLLNMCKGFDSIGSLIHPVLDICWQPLKPLIVTVDSWTLHFLFAPMAVLCLIALWLNLVLNMNEWR